MEKQGMLRWLACSLFLLPLLTMYTCSRSAGADPSNNKALVSFGPGLNGNCCSPLLGFKMMKPESLAAAQFLGSMVQAERAALEKQEEERFRQQALEKLAEEDRIEQMNAQRRRLKMAEHKREVERLLAEKRAIFEAALVLPSCRLCLSAACASLR